MNYRRPLSVIRVPRVNSRLHPSLRYRKRPVPGNIFISPTNITVFSCYCVSGLLCNVILKLSYLLVKTLNRILLVPELSVCMSLRNMEELSNNSIIWTSALDGSEWSPWRSSCFIPGERTSGTHWIRASVDVCPKCGLCGEQRNILFPAGIEPQFYVRTACSLVYWLCYPAPPHSKSGLIT